jgi:hypothetical protein
MPETIDPTRKTIAGTTDIVGPRTVDPEDDPDVLLGQRPERGTGGRDRGGAG